MRKIVVFLCLIATLFCLTAKGSQPTTISQVNIKHDRGFDYLDIYKSSDAKAEGLLLDDKLVITFPNSTLSQNFTVKRRGKIKRIGKIFAKQIKKDVQIFIGLKGNIDYEIVNVFGRDKTVVEVSKRSNYSEKLFAAWEKTNLKKKGQAIKSKKYQGTITGKNLPLKGKTVVLEPGHGGRDPGAITQKGIPEKNLTLPLARKIAQKLSQAGATVYLTRNSDRTTNLKDVVSFANRKDADIFISIHYNYFHRQDIAGTETFYYTRRSRSFAKAIHLNMIRGIKRKDRGLRRAMMYTVHHTHMPAVLIEPLYISNYQEAELAQSANFQNKIANSVARGVKSYFRSKNN